jgi:hypothetical protein
MNELTRNNMKKKRLHRRIAGLISLLVLAQAPLHAADRDDILLFSFFRDNGQAGIYLAASEDGLDFKPLNNDQPVMKPAPWEKQNLTRDPSIVYHDGKFHTVWTTNWRGDCFAYAESTDLVTWSAPVRVEPFPAGQTPRNTWAPEICWDPGQKNFMIVFSSVVDSARGQQMFVTRTADGKTFTPAKLYLDQKFGCIDGMTVLDETAAGKRWVVIYKNEEKTENGGKNLHIATAPADFSLPWTLEPAPIVGPGSSVRPQEMAEGPSLLQWKGSWYLYWDAFHNNHYSMASSPDLKTWTDRTAKLRLPKYPNNPRHGTVFRAPRAAVGWLKGTPADKKTEAQSTGSK